MQLYAYDKKGELTFSFHAEKKINYTCLECGSSVRLKEGLFRHPHFFHLQKQTQCRQNGKGMDHLQIQMHLNHFLPGNIFLEHRFPNIGRIADVYWEEKKIVFEIQCSSIQKKEVIQRISDYSKLGIKVVWIFHDKRFNKWRLSQAEMLDIPYYFTDMDENGNGKIYDQWDFIEKGLRKSLLPPLKIDISKPYFTPNFGFLGDLASLPEGDLYLEKIKKIEHKLQQEKRKKYLTEGFIFIKSIWHKILKIYSENI